MDPSSAPPTSEQIQQAASYIIAAIEQDYRYPHACRTSFACALSQLGKVEQMGAFAMESQYTADLMCKLLDSLYRFLVTKRTESEIHDLAVHFSSCVICNKNAFHSPGDWDMSDDNIGNLINLCFRLVGEWLFLDKTVLRANIKYSLFPKWPSNDLQLIPSTADELLSTLLQWYQIFKRPIILGAGVQIMARCWLELYHSMKRLDVTGAGFLEPMRMATDNAREQLKFPLLPAETDDPSSNATYEAFKAHIRPFCRYIDMVLCQPLRAGSLMNGGEVQALQLCTMVCYLVDSYARAYNQNTVEVALLRQIKQDIENIGANIFRSFFRIPREGYTLLLIFQHPDIVQKYHSGEGGQYVQAVQIAAAMVEFHNYTRCSATSKCVQAPSVNFSGSECLFACGGARYCQAECRIDHFIGNGEDEHIKVCGILCVVIRAYESSESNGKRPWKNWLLGKFDQESEELAYMAKALAGVILRCVRADIITGDDFTCLSNWSDGQVQNASWRNDIGEPRVYLDYGDQLFDRTSVWGLDTFPEPIITSGPTNIPTYKAIDDEENPLNKYKNVQPHKAPPSIVMRSSISM